MHCDPTAITHSRVVIAERASVAARVIFEDNGRSETVVDTGASVGVGAIIGAGIHIGRGAVIRPGCVVLSSVPPNAIVEGNPSRIIGYTNTLAQTGVVSSATAWGSKVGVTSLGVGAAALHRMRRISDLRGSLTVGEVERELPFIPKRYFIVFNVPSRELRGEHAHKKCAQFLICVAGSCQLLLDDGVNRREVLLNEPSQGVYMPPHIWGTQYQFSPDAALLVFASDLYDPADYLRTYEEFLTYIGKQHDDPLP
jgi:dTDP-4-dehydrorhamnose 3,5-epimerase-like enzyme